MKIYKKSELSYRNGYLIKDDEIVSVDNEIVDLLNELDIDIQRAMFDRARQMRADLVGGILDEDFNPKSEYGKPNVKFDTPAIDAKVAETMKVIKELDGLAARDRINERISGMDPVIRFVQEDFVVETDQPTQHRFDLPTIGNPLELDVDKLVESVVDIYDDDVHVVECVVEGKEHSDE